MPKQKEKQGEATSSTSHLASCLVSKETAAVDDDSNDDGDWLDGDKIFVMIMYMRRIIHQRNNFNNFHIIVGGMEDEYWEQRRREWEAWRAQERDKWDRQQRKATNRRERDDANRGYWELTEPVTTKNMNCETSLTLAGGQRSLLMTKKTGD